MLTGMANYLRRSSRWLANTVTNSGNELQSEWDTDGDGVLSDKEVEAAQAFILKQIEEERGRHFDDVDTDADGSLTLAEFTAAPGNQQLPSGLVKEIFDSVDSDGNGLVSKEEFGASIGPVLPPLGVGGVWAKDPQDLEEEIAKSLNAAFASMDTDSDGTVSRAEYLAAAKIEAPELSDSADGFFTAMDVDNDGQLTLSEFTGANLPQPHDPFKRMDTNGDGSLTQEELEASGAPAERLDGFLESLDANKDGVLSREEFEDGGPSPSSPLYLLFGHHSPFASLDENKDGQLSKEELEKNLPESLLIEVPIDDILEILDSNSDGVVSRAEFDGKA